MRRPKLGTHTDQQFKDFYWSVVCPKCFAPVGAPCADHRSYDLNLGSRNSWPAYVHKERDDIIMGRNSERTDTVT